MRQLSQKCENRRLETAQSKDSKVPHTIQTYSDLIRSLSEAEREIFEKFVRETWKAATGKEVASIRAFLADEEYRAEWYKKFVTSPAGRKAKDEAIAAETDWHNDPRFEEWLNKAYFVGRTWTMENCSDQAERTAFFNWAQKTNAYLGRIDGAT